MNYTKTLFFITAVSILLSACDKKEILPGKREALSGITETNELFQTSNITDYVNLSSATNITSFVDIEGNKQHSSLNYKMPKDLKTLWKTSIGGIRVNSNIIVFQGNLYVINSNGVLICLSQVDGKKLWEKLIAKQPDDAIFSGGLTANGSIIYISTNIGEVKAIDSKTQKELWSVNLKYPLKGAPLYSHGKIIINSIENQTFALDSLTGKVVWIKSASKENTIMSDSATAAELWDDVICAYTSGDLKSLNSRNGAINWEDVLFSANLSESGSVFSHIVASPVVFNGNVLVATSESKIALIDGASGIRLWEKEIGTLNTPAVNNDWIFVLSSDNQVICISAKSGSINWMKKIQDIYGEKYPENANWTGPLLINNDIVIFNDFGDMLELDKSTGKLNEKITIKNANIIKKPIIVNGKMFAITNRSDIYAIG